MSEQPVSFHTGPLPAHISCQEFMINSDTPGIELFVRNKRRQDITTFPGEKTVLFVAGSTYPASASFDLPLDGVSWMDQLANAGYNTYLVDVRGYGRSSKPAEMAQPALDHPPIVRTPVAASDVGTAAAFIREQNTVEKINLIGWSWGCALMGRYTTENRDSIHTLVHKLVLFAPQWLRDTPSSTDAGGPLGAYRTVTRLIARKRWLEGVPQERQQALLPEKWFDAWADATFGTHPNAEIKAPNGTIQDSRDFWAAGVPLYDPAQIRVPTLVLHAEWDRDCPLEMSRAVFSRLSSAPYRRWVEIGEGTHSVFMEKNRWQVFNAVQGFLDETSPD